VLLELWKKYGDRWLVELLFDDLLDANNWAVRERTPPGSPSPTSTV
jgi:hypothetical protein